MSELSFWFAVFKSPFYSIISFFPLFSTLSVPVIFTFHENLTFSHFLPYLAMLQSREFLVTCPCNTISQSWVMTPTAPSCDVLCRAREMSQTHRWILEILWFRSGKKVQKGTIAHEFDERTISKERTKENLQCSRLSSRHRWLCVCLCVIAPGLCHRGHTYITLQRYSAW